MSSSNPLINASSEDLRILESLVTTAPYFQKLFPIDNMIGVSDKEKYLIIVPGKLVKMPHDMVGITVPENDALGQAIRTGEMITMNVPKKLLALPLKGLEYLSKIPRVR